MAETWRITAGKAAMVRVLDATGGLLRPRRTRGILRQQEVRNVLVLEPWHIGDVVLATAVLRVMRDRFPDARITLLGKRYAEELLQHSSLVDEVIVFDLPWTSKTAKYDPRRYDWRALRSLLALLRSRNFDVTIDARMDARSNLLTFLTGARRRIGFDFGGATFLLTDAMPADPAKAHRVDDWLSLILPLVGDEAKPWDGRGPDLRYAPMLRVSSEEHEAAGTMLQERGIRSDDIVVAFHGGASDPRRMWPGASFERVAGMLAARYGAKCIFFLEPGAADRSIPVASAVLRTSLREMMAVLTHCDLFVCNDSGPMHIADALDVAVVAVFLTGNPVWHRPYRPRQSVVGAGTGHDFLIAPSEESVLAAAEEHLDRVASKTSSAAIAGTPR